MPPIEAENCLPARCEPAVLRAERINWRFDAAGIAGRGLWGIFSNEVNVSSESLIENKAL